MVGEITELALPGCYVVRPVVRQDARGRFVKPFQASWFARAGLRTDFAEQYHSRSARGVVRGLHFQVPPADHAKLVSCVSGRVFDVALDLRVGSPTYGQVATVELDGETARAVYLPSGIAHGFQALEDGCTVLYAVTSEFAPDCDAGVLWSSAGIRWPIERSIVSDRDRALPPLDAFRSPFTSEAR